MGKAEVTNAEEWREVHEKHEVEIKSKEIDEPIEPPCKNCFWWKPVRIFDRFGKYNGIQFCHSMHDGTEYMSPMFLCFIGREEMEKILKEDAE